ncbi:MAG: hypothetical protein V4760_02545 [Bdellovibrionota bacterium]
MRFLLVFHIVVTALLGVFVFTARGEAAALSVLAGGLVSFLNLTFLVITWPRLLAKKQVALAIATIVFKFALLGWILYFVAQSQAIRLGWFATGLGVVIASVLATAIFATPKDEELPA